jgi:hypothetical protein
MAGSKNPRARLLHIRGVIGGERRWFRDRAPMVFHTTGERPPSTLIAVPVM